jgi:hypothetical protein
MDTAIASFPSEGGANEVRDLLTGQGIEAAVEYRGPRAWQLLLHGEDAPAASFVLAELGYLACETGGA